MFDGLRLPDSVAERNESEVLSCLRQAHESGAVAALVQPPSTENEDNGGEVVPTNTTNVTAAMSLTETTLLNWTAVLSSNYLPLVVMPADVPLPTDIGLHGFAAVVQFVALATPAPTPYLPPVPPHPPISAIPERDNVGQSEAHHRVIIFVGFCIACFFVSTLYCRTRSAQIQNNAAMRRSMWLVTLLEHEATSDARLQIRSEAAGRVLSNLPVRIYGEPTDGETCGTDNVIGSDGDAGGDEYLTVVGSSSPHAKGDVDTCCICIDEYAQGDKIATLPCGHEFHSDCISPWLQQQCVCPLCKRDLLEGTGEDPEVFRSDGLHHGGAPPEGWRAFLELILDSQFADSWRGSTTRARRSLQIERPSTPEPSLSVDGDGETFVIDFDPADVPEPALE